MSAAEVPSLLEMVKLDRALERCSREIDRALDSRDFASLRYALDRRAELRARRDSLLPEVDT